MTLESFKLSLSILGIIYTCQIKVLPRKQTAMASPLNENNTSINTEKKHTYSPISSGKEINQNRENNPHITVSSSKKNKKNRSSKNNAKENSPNTFPVGSGQENKQNKKSSPHSHSPVSGVKENIYNNGKTLNTNSPVSSGQENKENKNKILNISPISDKKENGQNKKDESWRDYYPPSPPKPCNPTLLRAYMRDRLKLKAIDLSDFTLPKQYALTDETKQNNEWIRNKINSIQDVDSLDSNEANKDVADHKSLQFTLELSLPRFEDLKQSHVMMDNEWIRNQINTIQNVDSLDSNEANKDVSDHKSLQSTLELSLPQSEDLKQSHVMMDDNAIEGVTKIHLLNDNGSDNGIKDEIIEKLTPVHHAKLNTANKSEDLEVNNLVKHFTKVDLLDAKNIGQHLLDSNSLQFSNATYPDHEDVTKQFKVLRLDNIVENVPKIILTESDKVNKNIPVYEVFDTSLDSASQEFDPMTEALARVVDDDDSEIPKVNFVDCESNDKHSHDNKNMKPILIHPSPGSVIDEDSVVQIEKIKEDLLKPLELPKTPSSSEFAITKQSLVWVEDETAQSFSNADSRCFKQIDEKLSVCELSELSKSASPTELNSGTQSMGSSDDWSIKSDFTYIDKNKIALELSQSLSASSVTNISFTEELVCDQQLHSHDDHLETNDWVVIKKKNKNTS